MDQLIDAECPMDGAEAIACGLDVSAHELEKIANPQRVGQVFGRREKSEPLRASHAIMGQVHAVDEARARGERQPSAERPEEARLSRSVGADQSEPASRRYREADVMNDPRAGPIDRRAIEQDRRVHVSIQVFALEPRCSCRKTAAVIRGSSSGAARPAMQTTATQILTIISAARLAWMR